MPADPVAAPAALRARVRAAVERAWADAVASGRLPALDGPGSGARVEVERPANPAFGDFATNLAMKLARPLRRSPLDIAEALAESLRGEAGAGLVASAEVARPGFVNVRIADAAYEGLVDGILAAPAAWGRIPAVNPRRVNVEFVSANPTGPLTVGNARGAFVGDLLCRVLEAGGQEVVREYYFNDSGAQIDHLGASVAAVRRGEPVPEDGYKGAYVEAARARGPRRRLGRRDGRWRRRRRGPGRLGVDARARDDRGEPRAARRPLRRLEERGISPRGGLGGARRGPPAGRRARSTSRTARPGSARRPTATTRTASSTAPTAGRRTSPPTSAT